MHQDLIQKNTAQNHFQVLKMLTALFLIITAATYGVYSTGRLSSSLNDTKDGNDELSDMVNSLQNLEKLCIHLKQSSDKMMASDNCSQ